jgi:hypothetical protein
MSLEKAIKMSLNDDTFAIIAYSAINFYIFEQFETKNQRIIFAGLSIFGFNVLLNYLRLDDQDKSESKVQSSSYNDSYLIQGNHNYIDPTATNYYY